MTDKAWSLADNVPGGLDGAAVFMSEGSDKAWSLTDNVAGGLDGAECYVTGSKCNIRNRVLIKGINCCCLESTNDVVQCLG